jgi:hypothetical protein
MNRAGRCAFTGSILTSNLTHRSHTPGHLLSCILPACFQASACAPHAPCVLFSSDAIRRCDSHYTPCTLQFLVRFYVHTVEDYSGHEIAREIASHRDRRLLLSHMKLERQLHSLAICMQIEHDIARLDGPQCCFL